jgi:ribokinase
MESTLHALNNLVNVTTIFNPSPLPTFNQINSFPWHKVDWLLVNEGEALDLYNTFVHKDRDKVRPGTAGPIHEMIAGLSEQPPLSNTNIICTLGEDGVLAVIPRFHKRNALHGSPSFMSFPAVNLQGTTRDTTGAGDCFTGYFVAGLMEFGPHAEVGREIQEEDIARLLKTCVQVHVLSLHLHFTTDLLQAAGMCVEKQGTIDSIPSRNEVETRMSAN